MRIPGFSAAAACDTSAANYRIMALTGQSGSRGSLEMAIPHGCCSNCPDIEDCYDLPLGQRSVCVRWARICNRWCIPSC